MTRKEIKKHALESLSGKWGIAVLVTLVVYGGFFNLFPYILQISIDGWLGQELSLIGWLLSILIQVILIPLLVGTTWFFLELSRKQTVKFKDVFLIYSDLKLSLKMVGLNLIIVLFVILWTLLLIIPGFIKAIAYSQAYYILKDKPELTVFEAIKESNKLMKGYKWKYFVFYMFSFIGWELLSILTFGFGFIFLIPYMNTAMASFYNDIRKQNNSANS